MNYEIRVKAPYFNGQLPVLRFVRADRKQHDETLTQIIDGVLAYSPLNYCTGFDKINKCWKDEYNTDKAAQHGDRNKQAEVKNRLEAREEQYAESSNQSERGEEYRNA